MDKRTPIGKFVQTSWTNMNIRCGKYRHLQTKNKCKSYETIQIEFTREEFKNWCKDQEGYILNLKRPSIDRIDSNCNYSLDNIRVIELSENIRTKKPGTAYLNGPKSNTFRGVRKSGRKWTTRITINTKEKHLGTFDSEQEAAEAFIDAYVQYYGKKPW